MVAAVTPEAPAGTGGGAGRGVAPAGDSPAFGLIPSRGSTGFTDCPPRLAARAHVHSAVGPPPASPPGPPPASPAPPPGPAAGAGVAWGGPRPAPAAVPGYPPRQPRPRTSSETYSEPSGPNPRPAGRCSAFPGSLVPPAKPSAKISNWPDGLPPDIGWNTTL